jgi:hypothetical protein
MRADRFDPVYHRRQRELFVFESGEQLDAEFDRVVFAAHVSEYAMRR